MLIYSGTNKEFLESVENATIVNKILDKYKIVFGNSGTSQINSWKNSLDFMYRVLEDGTVPLDAGVAIEYNIPATSKRVDFIISGIDETEKENCIIIELKQWEKCIKASDKDGVVVTYVGGANREVPHPSYQALTYARLLTDFNERVYNYDVNINPCAYLHNYKVNAYPDLVDNSYLPYINEAPLFCFNEEQKLKEFIKKYINKGDKGRLLVEIENGKIRPSKMLQDSINSMLKGNQEFMMIDDQKVVYEEALKLFYKSEIDNKKRVLVVEGGPGTGKTVLAINLLVKMINENKMAAYVTKNSAPRTVFKEKLIGDYKGKYIDYLFKGSGSFVDSNENDFGCLIVDEAHRLNEKSGLFSNLGENQIKEIIKASKFSVFFLDEDQRVTVKDIGSLEEIKKQAKNLNAEVITTKLESQFRCNGSDGYLAWLDNVLEIKETANKDFDIDYDFKVFDDPNELRKAIEEKNKTNNKSRLVAGYCWDWISEGKHNTLVHDIKIPEYNFEMSWNLDNGVFATDIGSINEVGCIHTVQGLEFDYVGVIIGEDMRYEDGHIVADFTKRAKTDQSIKGMKKMYKEKKEETLKLADTIIKNTYRTLMTRGVKGCYVYCVDNLLLKHLKNQLTR